MQKVGWRLIAWLVLLAASQSVWAAEDAVPAADKAPKRYLRVTRDAKKSPVAMETPIVRFTKVDGDRQVATVDLVAAVHIADKSYYEQLNREFAGYDAVLYELVTPEDAPAPRQSDPSGNHPLTLVQTGMKDLLGLEYQLKGVDYTVANMVHADMSPDQFAESMRNRGESMMTMIARVLGHALSQQGEGAPGGSDASLFFALFAKDRPTALKRILAVQFENSDGAMAALDGPNGSTLIAGRNQVALKVLRREMDAGKRKLAIFYGAAHMPDFQKRLQDEFGMKPTETRWLVAWKLQP